MKVFETFLDIGNHHIANLTQEFPSCFNGNVSVTKVRVTIEKIEEPIEVIHARIQKLWDKNTNHHHVRPLREAASYFGLTLNQK